MAAEIKRMKKLCRRACDPPTTTSTATTGSSCTVPEEDLSSLLSSLSVTKRPCPSAAAAAADHHHHALKRPRHHAQPLHDQMRGTPTHMNQRPDALFSHPLINAGLEIRCDEDDMEEGSTTSTRPPHCRDRLDWSGFLPELLRLICRRLPLADVPRFASVCKHWNSCAFPVYPADAGPVLLHTLVTGAGSVRFYHPYVHKIFVLSTPRQTQGSRVFSADGNGCLMLQTPRKTIMFVNLLDDDAGPAVFETPPRENDEGFICCTPHGDGDRPYDRSIFAVYPHMGRVRIQIWDRGSWKSFPSVGGFFTMSFSCNPVMHKGKLYCLGEDGDLGVYDPIKTEWAVLPKPTGFGPGIPYMNCYLIESQGELLAALTGSSNQTPIHVLRLNKKKMEWERMESLGGRALFTGTASSMLMARPPQSMANKVYLPRFYGRRPQVIQAELATSAGRLFFVPKEETLLNEDAGSGPGGSWCYELESNSYNEQFTRGSSKNLPQYMWVHLGNSASPTSESDDGMVIG
ncbi:uncharacterized protein LOC124648738 [Lolium rigidum]|uniref:uncharacterized protein LOC124648738 n=1 Tax=Lolium rigidum TaxID=89674 RepID=UPI001F5D1A54|nr:uncharacterized protein LOC124648738 [Lolium rigidum]